MRIFFSLCRLAAGNMGEVAHHCPWTLIEKLREKAVLVFGPLKDWSAAIISECGSIIAGATAEELKALNASVMPLLKTEAIPLIPPQNIKALSSKQLRSLGPTNAAAVTEDQKAVLNEDQKAALSEVMGVRYQRQASTTITPLTVYPGAVSNGVPECLRATVLIQALLLLPRYAF
ncbi:otoancorin-like [Latimeria chalumnae]|uniref:otoancorin-like n=1 Tax=Latimeria chalumnae TaxID=7897 RepID=UPI00313F308D